MNAITVQLQNVNVGDVLEQRRAMQAKTKLEAAVVVAFSSEGLVIQSAKLVKLPNDLPTIIGMNFSDD